MDAAGLYLLQHLRAEIEALQCYGLGELHIYSLPVVEDRIVWLDEEVLEQLVRLNVDEQGVVGATRDRSRSQHPPKEPETTLARAVGDQRRRRGMQLRTDQRFVGEYATPVKIDDRLENHAEALVTKRLVEGPGRGGNGIGRVHEKQSSRRASPRWSCGRRLGDLALPRSGVRQQRPLSSGGSVLRDAHRVTWSSPSGSARPAGGRGWA